MHSDPPSPEKESLLITNNNNNNVNNNALPEQILTINSGVHTRPRASSRTTPATNITSHNNANNANNNNNNTIGERIESLGLGAQEKARVLSMRARLWAHSLRKKDAYGVPVRTHSYAHSRTQHKH